MPKNNTNLNKDISDFLKVFQLDPAMEEKVVENISSLKPEEQEKVLAIIVSKMRDLNVAQQEFLKDLKRIKKQTLQAEAAADDEMAEAEADNLIKNI